MTIKNKKASLDMWEEPTNKEVLHVRRDLITKTVIPILLKQGFININEILDVNMDTWGWSPGMGYRYILANIIDGKFVAIKFFVFYKGNDINIDMKIYDTFPKQKAIRELNISRVRSETIHHAITGIGDFCYSLYPGCAKHSNRWWSYLLWKKLYYHLKGFTTRRGLQRRAESLRKQLISDFTDVHAIVNICLQHYKPKTINLITQSIETMKNEATN